MRKQVLWWHVPLKRYVLFADYQQRTYFKVSFKSDCLNTSVYYTMEFVVTPLIHILSHADILCGFDIITASQPVDANATNVVSKPVWGLTLSKSVLETRVSQLPAVYVLKVNFFCLLELD